MTSASSPSIRCAKRGSWKSANSFLLLATRERNGLTMQMPPVAGGGGEVGLVEVLEQRAAVDELDRLVLDAQRRAVVGDLVERGVVGTIPAAAAAAQMMRNSGTLGEPSASTSASRGVSGRSVREARTCA